MVREALGVELAAVEPEPGKPKRIRVHDRPTPTRIPSFREIWSKFLRKIIASDRLVVLLLRSRRQTVKWTVVYRLYRAGEQFQWQ